MADNDKGFIETEGDNSVASHVNIKFMNKYL